MAVTWAIFFSLLSISAWSTAGATSVLKRASPADKRENSMALSIERRKNLHEIYIYIRNICTDGFVKSNRHAE